MKSQYSNQNACIVFLIVCAMLASVVLLSCDARNSSPSTEPSTCSVQFSIVPSKALSSVYRAAVLNCAELGIHTISAYIYSSDGALLKSGGPWDCETGQGTITGVPAGQNANVIITCLDENNQIIYRGQSQTILLTPGQNVDAGVISTTSFVPVLSTPTIDTTVDIGAFTISWNTVTGASGYEVQVSDSSDFQTVLLDQTVSDTSLILTGLNINTTYYWQVNAQDAYGNAGADSSTWNFTTSSLNPPQVSIDSPTDSSSFDFGHEVSFSGTATDVEDGVLSGESLVWTSSIDGQIGTGTSFSISTLSSGTHTITLTATDSNGGAASATVTITINAPVNQLPQVTIISPIDGQSYSHGITIVFSGTAVDAEDGALSGGSMLWTSDIDGELGFGNELSLSTLSLGYHTITLTAVDSQSAATSVTIHITVIEPTNSPPIAQITSPSDNASYTSGDSITFTGLGTDPQDGTLTGTALVWTSSIDGQIGTGESFTDSELSNGTHVITLTVTDSQGSTGSTSVTITVNPPGNSAPTAQINSPFPNSSYTVGQSINFSGTGSDPEDGPLTGASLVWTSSINGQIGTGESFSLSSLSLGSHTITLTATDSQGASATSSVNITVNPVPNSSPSVNIYSPNNGAVYTEGDMISFQGSATDAEDGELTGSSLVWTSNISGQIGTGNTFSRQDIATGNHVITLKATDSQGAFTTQSVSITINAITPNSLPTANIFEPKTGTTFYSDQSIYFQGNGVDVEDGFLPASALVWSSSIDGNLGTGTDLTVTRLTPGRHTITLTVTDSQGGTGSTYIAITVSESISPTYDLTGTWSYYTSNLSVIGDCPSGSATKGEISISQRNDTFTLQIVSGSTCSPSGVCTFTGTVSGNTYTCSNTVSDLRTGTTITNTMSFTATSNSYASGTSTSNYDYGGYTCSWGSDITMTR